MSKPKPRKGKSKPQRRDVSLDYDIPADLFKNQLAIYVKKTVAKILRFGDKFTHPHLAGEYTMKGRRVTFTKPAFDYIKSQTKKWVFSHTSMTLLKRKNPVMGLLNKTIVDPGKIDSQIKRSYAQVAASFTRESVKKISLAKDLEKLREENSTLRIKLASLEEQVKKLISNSVTYEDSKPLVSSVVEPEGASVPSDGGRVLLLDRSAGLFPAGFPAQEQLDAESVYSSAVQNPEFSFPGSFAVTDGIYKYKNMIFSANPVCRLRMYDEDDRNCFFEGMKVFNKGEDELLSIHTIKELGLSGSFDFDLNDILNY